MHSQKSQKIDLAQDYPCPCRRKGHLQPIALTEAFGCDRCQQIFVVEENGHVLEQLSGSYPYKKAWRWNGHQWSVAGSRFGNYYLPLALSIVMVMLALGLLLSRKGGDSEQWVIVVLIIGILLLAVLPALMLWFAYSVLRN